MLACVCVLSGKAHAWRTAAQSDPQALSLSFLLCVLLHCTWHSKDLRARPHLSPGVVSMVTDAGRGLTYLTQHASVYSPNTHSN